MPSNLSCRRPAGDFKGAFATPFESPASARRENHAADIVIGVMVCAVAGSIERRHRAGVSNSCHPDGAKS